MPPAPTQFSTIWGRPVAGKFFLRHPTEVARDLIGLILIVRDGATNLAGRIVETEAYHQSEPAAHSFRGATPRTQAMFEAAPRTYVYRSYGLHWCLNLVTGNVGEGSAVLIRAIEPLVGLSAMAAKRGTKVKVPHGLCRGPGNVAQALGLDLGDNNRPLRRDRLFVARPSKNAVQPLMQVARSSRVGITKAADLPWRYYERGNRFVSATRL